MISNVIRIPTIDLQLFCGWFISNDFNSAGTPLAASRLEHFGTLFHAPWLAAPCCGGLRTRRGGWLGLWFTRCGRAIMWVFVEAN